MFYSYIPGDHLGAAGLDSALWPHLKFNWIRGKRRSAKDKRNGKQLLRKKTGNIQPIRFEELEQMRKNSYDATYTVTPRVKFRKQNKKQKVKISLKKNVKKKKVLYYDKIGKVLLI